MKRGLEAYQKERYPELRHSLVFEDTKQHLRPHDTHETHPIPPAVLPPAVSGKTSGSAA